MNNPLETVPKNYSNVEIRLKNGETHYVEYYLDANGNGDTWVSLGNRDNIYFTEEILWWKYTNN